jgi:prepilin-type processing-associated H-X9-DG protein
MSPEVFVCPSGNTAVPGGLNPQQQAKWVDENSDYIYLGATMKANMDSETILAYEKPNNHDNQGVNVLFNDGHVDWYPMPVFEQVLARDKQLKAK